MRFKLLLETRCFSGQLPFNYQYPLSSAIYHILQRSDEDFAAFLHNHGYGKGHKSFKFFTFSDVRTPFVKEGDRMRLLTNKAEMVVCFYLPRAAESFIKGLFMHQQLEIADRKSKVVFTVTGIEGLPQPAGGDTLVLKPLSPIVAGRKNERGHYDYRSPMDFDFGDCLIHNWVEKYASIHETGEEVFAHLKSTIKLLVRLYPSPPQQRLITIKGGTPEETKIRGYTKFKLEVKAPPELLEVALGTGLGLNNSMGMGCVGIV